jgi:hypothetical protein
MLQQGSGPAAAPRATRKKVAAPRSRATRRKIHKVADQPDLHRRATTQDKATHATALADYKNFCDANGHRVWAVAAGATIYTRNAGLAHLASMDKATWTPTQVSFVQELRANKTAGMIIVLDDDYTAFPEPLLRVPTLPASHDPIFPTLCACNRTEGCCGFTSGIREALSKLSKPVFAKADDAAIQKSSMLRVSAAVILAKTEGMVALEVVNDRYAKSFYRAFVDSKLVPGEELTTKSVMAKIAANPLRINHLLFLVSSKEADPGDNLAEVGGYPSLRAHVPAPVLAAIAAVNKKKADAKKKKAGVLVTVSKSEEASDPDLDEEAGSSEEEANEGDLVSDDFMYDD